METQVYTFAFDSLSTNPRQQEALKLSLETPVLFYGGAKGGGKSHLVRVKEIVLRLAYPGSKGLIVRKTYPELIDNHINKMFSEYPHMRAWYNKSEKTIYYPNGSTTTFSYLKSTDDVYTYQGREFENITIDEITQHEEQVFKILRSSLRTTRKDIRPTMLLTGNPGGVGHSWVKRLFVDRNFRSEENPDDFAFVQAKVFDNQTLMQADPEYVKRLQDLPEHLKKAYLDGDWNIFAGQAFPQLSYDTHLVEPFDLPPNTRYIAGYDHGYNHPFSFVLLGITPDGTVYVTQHYSSRLLEVPEIAKGIKEHLRGRKVQIFAGHDLWYPGRGGGASVFEQFQDNGVTGFIRAKIDRVQGVAQIRKYISLLHGKPQLFFFKTSTVLDLFNTVAGMQYDPKNPEDVVKVDAIDGVGGDDSYDAFRYALMSRATPNSPFAEPPKVFSGNWILESLASKEDDDY